MQFIVITTDVVFDGDASVLNKLFAEGMPRLHLRKPFATELEMKILLSQIKEEYYSRIVLHDHFNLLQSFPLGGIHLNRRNPTYPNIKVASVSRSCHSFASVQANIDTHNYLFLSPIFNSISKSSYSQAFTYEQLIEAKAEKIINEKIIALGGIDEKTIPQAAKYGFGGVAVLGSLWADFIKNRDDEALIKRFNNLLTITRRQ